MDMALQEHRNLEYDRRIRSVIRAFVDNRKSITGWTCIAVGSSGWIGLTEEFASICIELSRHAKIHISSISIDDGTFDIECTASTPDIDVRLIDTCDTLREMSASVCMITGEAGEMRDISGKPMILSDAAFNLVSEMSPDEIEDLIHPPVERSA